MYRMIYFNAAVIGLLLMAVSACQKAPAPVSTPMTEAAQKVDATLAGVAQAKAMASAANASDPSAAPTTDPTKPPLKVDADGYRELDWLEMMPKDELDAMKALASRIDHNSDRRMEQFGSFRTVGALDQQKLRVPGYVVPIESDGEGLISEFFLVPYFGACVHVPPPPPNQIIYAKLAKPIKTPDMWQPYWLRGSLRTNKHDDDLASSAYTMEAADLVLYK